LRSVRDLVFMCHTSVSGSTSARGSWFVFTLSYVSSCSAWYNMSFSVGWFVCWIVATWTHEYKGCWSCRSASNYLTCYLAGSILSFKLGRRAWNTKSLDNRDYRWNLPLPMLTDKRYQLIFRWISIQISKIQKNL